MMSSFRICDGVNWEVSNGQTGIARFSESALSDHRHKDLASLVRYACIDTLMSMLDETVGRGTFGEVRTFKEAPHVVAKLHSEPFSNTALNASLEAGLTRIRGDIDLSTPTYIGYVQGFNHLDDRAGYTAMTLMSRVEGLNLSNVLASDQHPAFRQSDERNRLIGIASDALNSVGVDPSIAYWPDIHENNLMVPRNSIKKLEDLSKVPVAVIDIPTASWASEQMQRTSSTRPLD